MHRFLAAVSASLLLAACGSAAAPASSPASAAPASQAAAKPASSASAAPSAAAKPSASAAAGASGAGVTPLSPRGKLILSLNPGNISFLPMFLALDKGAFEKAGLDLDVKKFDGSTTTQLPLLARGDLDIAPANASPALFNQVAQGFDARVVASLGAPKEGRATTAWLVVAKDVADKIKDYPDLKGHSMDISSQGTPLALMGQEALRLGNLTPKDVTVTDRIRTVPDMLALAKAHGADVMAMVEPVATQSQTEGYVVRWKSIDQVVPWYQASLLAVSKKALDTNRPAVEKFLEVYLSSAREIDASNGTWTPELLTTVTKWTGLKEDVVKALGGAVYYDPNGALSVDSLTRVQDVWMQQQQVKEKVDPAKIADSSLVEEAVGKIGKG
jgi:NitT/TauT family transport system substrate-binding protein